MASDNLYIEVEVFKATIQVPGTSYLDDDIDKALSSASRGVDMVCAKSRLRRFYSDESDTVRKYTAFDHRLVEINDINTLTTIELDQDGDGDYEIELIATDYHLLPLNAEEDAEPWTHIRLTEFGAIRFIPTTASIQVTGKFGWATTPPAVVEATGLVANRLLKRKREAAFGVVGFGIDQAAAISIARSDPDVQALLKPFMRMRTAISVSIE